MSAFNGSSPIPVYARVISGPAGPAGPCGPEGPIGPTGFSFPGNTGPTGVGIDSISYLNKGICFHNSNGNTFYVQFPGITGVSYLNNIPQGILIAKGLTAGNVNLAGYSVLYSYVDRFISNNEVIIQPPISTYENSTNNEIYLKLRTIEAGGQSLKGISSDSSYIYIVGNTYNSNNFIVGNTGEVLYVKNNLLYSILNSKYDETLDLLDIPMSADRHSIFGNQNINNTTYNFSLQNISGIASLTGIGFFNVKYGDFQIDSNNHILVENPALAKTTLYLGTTGSDTLTFKFVGVTYSNQSTFQPQAIGATGIGSCCFCDNSSGIQINCTDYVSREYCSAIGGNFNVGSCSGRISSGDCYVEGACCVNGKCINTYLEKCLEYRGTFYPGELCSSGSSSPYFTCPANICPSSTVTGKCCRRGFCLTLTEPECIAIPDAVFTPGAPCSSPTDSTCCANLLGACCELVTASGESNYQCTQKTASACANGIFHGIGTSCTEVECCGKNFSQSYFNSSESCSVNTIQPCFPIGTKIGGGYLVGVIGAPSPCNSFQSPLFAYGQPLTCRVMPRGEQLGSQASSWPWKNCKGIPGYAPGTTFTRACELNIKYFARTKSSNTIDLNYNDNGTKNCLVKYGCPHIQQTAFDELYLSGKFTEIRWPDEIQFIGSEDYNELNGRFAYPIASAMDLNYLVTEINSDISPTYKYLAKQVYGENSVHMLWALILAPDDAYNGVKVSWGMSEGRTTLTSYNLEPITSFAVDGLLATRLFDETSKQNPRLWFRGTSNQDNKAYDRFAFYTSVINDKSNWPSGTSENDIENDINKFSQKYIEMWDLNNPQNSAIRQISLLNQSQYNGYSDWYIPSIVELNYIYQNYTGDLATEIVLNEDDQMQPTEYWSSTSVCYLKNWDLQDPYNYGKYEDFAESPILNTKNRFFREDYPGLNDKTAYELSLNTCAGEHMLTQRFNIGSTDNENRCTTSITNVQTNNAGLIESFSRKNGRAVLRPVRRIPIIVGCINDNIETYINSSYFNTCNSCPGCQPTFNSTIP